MKTSSETLWSNPGWKVEKISDLKKLLTLADNRSPSQGTERVVLTLILPNTMKFLIATLVEEMKPVFSYNYDFEFRDESKVIAYFGSFGILRLRCEEKVKKLSIAIFFTKLKISVKTKLEDNTLVVTESYESQCRDTAVKKALFRISDCQ